MNREAWLTEMAGLLASLFPGGLVGRPYRVTCGWPSVQGLGARTKRVGECHAPETSKAGVHELFISPLLDDPLDVAGTLAHELAHVAAGVKAAHGKGFVSVCKQVGLTRGKPRNMMPGVLLETHIKDMLTNLPPYPHQGLIPVVRKIAFCRHTTSVVCTGCGFRFSVANKWIETSGMPTCGCGTLMIKKDQSI